MSVLALLVVIWLSSSSRTTYSKEIGNIRNPVIDTVSLFCGLEVFQARCSHDEVIVIKRAIYGRMRLGRCVVENAVFHAFKDDPKYFGCSANVLHIADRKCSGNRECDIRVPDADFESVTPCYEDSKNYLEIEYTCLKMIEDDGSCTVYASSLTTYLSGTTSTNLGCGSKSNPWELKALPGQIINARILDFQAEVDTAIGSGSIDKKLQKNNCLQYGYILDKHAKKNISICGGGQQERERIIYASQNNGLEIFITLPETPASTGIKFFIGFDAVGCLNLRAPIDAWFKRNNDEATIGCYATRQTWHLRCQGNQWIGVFGNCTQYLETVEKEALSNIELTKEEGFSNDLVIVCIVGIGLVICLMIICVGIVCLQRRKVKSTKYSTFVGNGRNVSNDKDFNPTGLNGVMNIRSADESLINRISSEPTTIRINQPNNHGDYSVYARDGNGYFGGGEDRLKQAQYFVLDPNVVGLEDVLQN